MSLVITAVSKRPARRRPRAAPSAVLPGPTGPPIPTRSGPTRSAARSGGKEAHLSLLGPDGVVLGPQLQQGGRADRSLGQRQRGGPGARLDDPVGQRRE